MRARTILRDLYPMLDEKVEEVRSYCTLTREILRFKLGKSFGERWADTGFVQSLAIPRSAEELIPLVIKLRNYLASNSALEVPDLKVTAAQLTILDEQLMSAVNAVNEHRTIVDNLLNVRNQKVRKLRKRMRDLIAELNQVIGPTDPRWLSFGLNMPGVEEAPEMPENIRVQVSNQTSALITFDRPARATYYRIYQRVVDLDAEPVYIGSPTDPNFTAENLRRGATIEFCLQAVNSGGESAMTEPIAVKIQ